jgi:antitoxin (DNA-binding transcriptional repressor) of toxin-antitoxin stability system
MVTITIDVHDLPNRLTEMVSLATGGTEVVVTDGDTPRAKLVPLSPPVQTRVAGLHAGALRTSEDFDAPLPEEFWAGKP